MNDLKKELGLNLNDLGVPIVICIDDVDRLEPMEALEITRLVRSVIDLPNIIYILLYDEKILSKSITEATGISDGSGFLEKIVQLKVNIPTPEPFQLRNWFANDLSNVVLPSSSEERDRLQQVIDYEGGLYLRTPRTLKKCLDAIKFQWPTLESYGCDLSDMVWITLIREGNADLYRWIERYQSTAALLVLGTAVVEDAERRAELARLMESVPVGHFNDIKYRWHFNERLIGCEIDFKENGEIFKLFDNDKIKKDHVAGRRINNSDHYRIYFAMTLPSHSLKESEIDDLKGILLQDVDTVSMFLRRMGDEIVSAGMSKLELIFERILDHTISVDDEKSSVTLIMAWGDIADPIYRKKGYSSFSFNTIWDRADKLFSKLLTHTGSGERFRVLERLAFDLNSLEWFARFVRREMFRHGIVGDRATPQDEWTLTSGEIRLVIDGLVSRIKSLGFSWIVSAIDPLELIFLWEQAGYREEMIKSVGTYCEGDEEFLRFLLALRTAVRSSEGEYLVLQRRYISELMDWEHMMKRIRKVKERQVFPELVAEIEMAISRNR